MVSVSTQEQGVREGLFGVKEGEVDEKKIHFDKFIYPTDK